MAIQSKLVPFDILTSPQPTRRDLAPFLVTTSRGFLPRADPLAVLPSDFAVLESILQRMPIKTLSGEPGLLASFSLGKAVLEELPDYTEAVEKCSEDLVVINALYRDYAFLASAYLLEPCHERHVAGLEYGRARDVLPANVARPIAAAARLIGFKPFMEYAGSYALYNYRLEDPQRGLEIGNLRLVRAFERGLDPESSEAGFVLVHVAMVRHSGLLVDGAVDVLEGCDRRDRDSFDQGMRKVVEAMRNVNGVMNTMWSRSKPNEYTDFRTFIFGITSQTMFPDGVLYEGVSKERLDFRGESGANDSMIPLLDNLLDIAMPKTPLTEILKDFRSYRPGNHKDFLAWVASSSQTIGVKPFALQDPHSAAMYLAALDQVREFRWRHWCFTKEYILRQTKYSRATGGSPIVTWLPNQIQAVLEAMLAAGESCKDTPEVSGMLELAASQKMSLQKEVEKISSDRGADSGA